MKKKIIVIFLAWSVGSTSAHADELGKIVGTVIGTVIGVLGFAPADRVIALSAFNQIGGYLGGKVNVAEVIAPTVSKPPPSLGNEKKVEVLVSDDAQDVLWYTRNLAQEDSLPVAIAEKKGNEKQEEPRKVSFEGARPLVIDI